MAKPFGRDFYSSSPRSSSDIDNRQPSPIYSYTRVRLGDVGYVRRGRFHLLFSAGSPLGSGTLGIDVPLTFEPLDVGPIIPGEVRSPGYLRTKTVQQIEVDVGGSVAVACTVEPGATLTFELTQKRGAALITGGSTYPEDIEREHTFETYIKRHYDSWVDFARELGHGKDVRPVLVTGVDLTREFATVAYSDNQTRMECEFSAAAHGVASTPVSVWGSWRTQGLVHTNCGPHPTRRNRRLGENTVPESEIPDEYSQCVFIRYYTIRKRIFIPTVLKAGAGPHRLSRGSHGDDNSCEEGLQVVSVADPMDVDLIDVDPMEVDHPETGSPGDAFDEVIHNVPMDDRDVFDVVAEFIFQRSDAKSVLLHHHDVQDFVQGDEGELSRLLAESGAVKKFEIDENGVGELLRPTATGFSEMLSDADIGDDIRGQTLPAQTSGVATRARRPGGRNDDLSSLNAAIEALNLMMKISGIASAKIAFRLVSNLLTTIRDSMIDQWDCIELGLSCADVCRALGQGANEKKSDELTQSVYDSINQLSLIVADIERKLAKRGKRSPVSRRLQAESDKKMITAWRLDLNKILHVFNTELVVNTRVIVPEMHHDVSREEIGGQVCSTLDSILGESPPPPPRACFGRDELIEEIVALAENLAPFALLGAGGIGKTSIALTVLHDDRVKQRFGENRRFVQCDQFPATLFHFLRRLSAVIGADVENPEDLTPLRPFLSSMDMFVVLDNAESILDPYGTDAQQIYTVVEELSQLSNVCLSITSRISTVPPDFVRLKVPVLSLDSARRTFSRIHGNNEQPDLIKSILEQLDFHPLSVVLLATAAGHNEWNINQLTTEWKRRRTELLHTQHNESLAATIELSLASPMFQELGPDARGLLDVVAFFPQGVDENNLDWLFPTIPERTNILSKFCILSLTYRSNGFITMLAPLRDYLCPKDPRSSPLLCMTKERYFTRISGEFNPNKPSFAQTQWIASDDVNIEHLLDVFTTIDRNSDSVWNACVGFMRRLYWHKGRLVVLTPKIEGLPDDHRSKPECLFELSRLFDSVGNRVERKQLLTHALKLWRGRGSDPWVARTLRDLSDVNRLMGLPKEGIQQAKEALEILGRLGDRARQARCLIELAWSLHDDKQLDAAEEAASLAIHRLQKKGNQFQVCQSHHLLGEIHRSKGRREKAVHNFKVALRIASPFNWHSQLFWIHYSLAVLFRDDSRFDDAQIHVEQVKSHAVNNAYNLGHAMKLQAELWYKQHMVEEARLEVLHAAEIYGGVGAANDVERCRELLLYMEGKPDIPVTSGQSGSSYTQPRALERLSYPNAPPSELEAEFQPAVPRALNLDSSFYVQGAERLR